MIDHTFAHSWKAEILPGRPLILPQRQFTYPLQVEEVERGAIEVLIEPPEPGTPAFLATCALGFAGPQVPSGVWSAPNPVTICIAAGGYVYLIDTSRPAVWEQVEYRPVTDIRPAEEQGLLLFASFHSVAGWNRAGKAWQTGRLSWDGIRLEEIRGSVLHGWGWDMQTDREIEFQVDLQSGQHQGGGYQR